MPWFLGSSPDAGRARGDGSIGGGMRVLLAVDGSIHSLRAAQFLVELASSRGAMELHVLNVQPFVRHLALLEADTHEQVDRLLLERGREATASVCAVLERSALPYEFHAAAGDAAEAIVRVARERSCDVIVMGRRGTSTAASLALGSVALKVLHLADAPVTLVK